ncbi:MAG: type IV secretory system conjugative DNA transfer family protein [Planctomycetota bacterium]
MVLSLLVGLQLGTQWVASRLNHNPALGFRVTVGDSGGSSRGRSGGTSGGGGGGGDGFRGYPPWGVLVWRGRFGDRYPELFATAFGLVALSVGIGVVTLAIVQSAPESRASRGRVRGLRDDHWAGKRELERAKLMTGRGTVVGKLATPRRWRRSQPDRYLTYDGPEHQLVSGASRAGKGVGHVVPTLLNWTGSALVYDVKNELWDLTAGFRVERVGPVLRFNPTASEGDSARYNPLLEIRKGPHEIRDTQNVVEILVNPDGAKRTFDVWDQNASQLLVALVLHVLYTADDLRKHLGTVREILLDFDQTLQDMQTLPHRLDADGQPQVHPEVARVAKELEGQPERFQASVRATAAGYLTLYADEIVCRNVAVSDFSVSDLVCGDRPVTLYLQPPPSDAPRLRPLIRLILNQVCRALMEYPATDSRGRDKQHRLLLMLDEFPTLGRLDFFTTNLRQMAGYGIKAHLIVQSFNDIVEQYGPHNTIIDNCHLLTAFASADTTTQHRVSQMTGTVVEYRDSYSVPHPRPRNLNPFTPRRGSVNTSEQVRPLLTPGQVRELPDDTQLIFVNGCKPIRCRKVRYYEEPAFTARLRDPPAPGNPPGRFGIESEASDPPAHDWTGERAKGPRLDSSEPSSSEPTPSAVPDDPTGDIAYDPDDRYDIA